MYGVPGFETSEDVEELAFDRIDENEAMTIASMGFNVEAFSAVRLDTERDDSFRLTTEHGDRVLKVAHPADEVSMVSLQLRALEFAAKEDRTLPLPRLVRTTYGGPLHILPSGRVSWMYHWMPGTLLRDAAEGADQIDALGTTLGRLSKSLRKFNAEDTLRTSAWDLQTVPRLSRLLAIFPNDAVSEAITRFNTRVEPRLGELPTQVIHGDFNPGNVLVEPDGAEFVVGILDFGDLMYSLRIADLAVALSYQISPLRHTLANVAPMIDAFDRQVHLTDLELDVLPDLVASRFAQRILVNSWLTQNGTERDNQHDANVSALTALLNLEA